MLAKTKVAKLAEELEDVNARVRNMDIDEAISAIEKAEIKMKDVPAELRKMVVFVHIPHSVAAGYGHQATGTGIEVKFSRTGKAIEAHAGRFPVGVLYTSRLEISGMVEFMKEKFGVEKPDFSDPKRIQYNKLFEFVERLAGFNHYGYKYV